VAYPLGDAIMRARAWFRILLTLAVLRLAACGGTQPRLIESRHGVARSGTDRVLVLYATRAGSTGEVADFIGKKLAEAGYVADVRPVTDAPRLSDYRAVVVGTAIRMGSVLPEALDFVRDHRLELQSRPIAYFLLCMKLKEDTAENRQVAAGYLDPLRVEVQPVDIGLFAGKLDSSKLGFWEGTIATLAGGSDGDLRNWKAIEAWSLAVAPKLRQDR
jgi:menaquinone-dependent protoporphyrinogen oxidase